MSEPLVELVRGELVDEIHRGDLAIVTASGELLASAGDPRGKIAYWRSSAKPFQAIPLMATGAAERWQLTAEDVALVAASHNGEPEHVERAAALLDRIGGDLEELECGIHPPLDPAAARALAERGEQPTPLHNNCSGKHVGMLAVATQLGAPRQGYRLPDHPVQQEILAAVARFAGLEADDVAIGLDGCGVPCFGTSVYHLALAFARLMEPEGRVDEPHASAAAAVRDAMSAHPYLVAGRSRLDTDLMRAGGGALVSKGGAGGVQCVGVRGGIGVAVKIEDGASIGAAARPAGVVAVETLRQLGVLDTSALESHLRPRVQTLAGELAGVAYPLFELGCPAL